MHKHDCLVLEEVEASDDVFKVDVAPCRRRVFWTVQISALQDQHLRGEDEGQVGPQQTREGRVAGVHQLWSIE